MSRKGSKEQLPAYEAKGKLDELHQLTRHGLIPLIQAFQLSIEERGQVAASSSLIVSGCRDGRCSRPLCPTGFISEFRRRCFGLE